MGDKEEGEEETEDEGEERTVGEAGWEGATLDRRRCNRCRAEAGCIQRTIAAATQRADISDPSICQRRHRHSSHSRMCTAHSDVSGERAQQCAQQQP